MTKNPKPLLVRIENGKGFQRLLAGPPETAGLKSGCVTLKPGQSVGKHRTEGREEAIVILEGKAGVVCDGFSSITAQAMSVVYIPPETDHDVKNAGEEPLRYVYLVASTGPNPRI